MSKSVGEIKLTSSYVTLVQYRRMDFPRIVKSLPRTEKSVEALRKLAEKKGITLL